MSQQACRRVLHGLVLCVVATGLIVTPSAASASTGATWTFEADETEQPPRGFAFGTTGSGEPGQWIVQSEPAAPSGQQVLAQLSTDPTDYRFPVAVAIEPLVRDASVSVTCKMVSGKVDQACGLVIRYQDQDNYYVTRANALEQNVRFYKVVGGQREQLASWRGVVTAGRWHELRIQAQKDRFTVFWDGKPIIDAADQAFQEAGHVGVWTKADAVTYYDDLKVEPIGQ